MKITTLHRAPTLLQINEEASSGKGCLMIAIPEPVAIQLKRWRDSNLLAKDVIELEDWPHTTVVYGVPDDVLGQDIEVHIAKYTCLNELGSTFVKFGKIKRFPLEDRDALVIEVEVNGEIKSLHYGLKQTYGIQSEHPTYSPHVTLAYVFPGAAAELEGVTPLGEISVECDEMVYSPGHDSPNKRVISFKEFTTPQV